jgi:hypothetical protein
MGDLARMQAGTRVNAEQASKRAMWEPTRLRYGEGRRFWTSRATVIQGSHRGSGAGMYARGSQEQHGKPPVVSGCAGQPPTREGGSGPLGVAERPVVARKPGNAGGAKGPWFRVSVVEVGARRLA